MNKKKNFNRYRTDSYFIGPNDDAWSSCDSICWNAKNLRNYANYIIRQEYIKNKKYLDYYDIDKIFRQNKPECSKNFPSKPRQNILAELDQDWKSYFACIKEYRKNPHKFQSRPKIPGYKDSKHGRCKVTFDAMCISTVFLRKNLLKLTSLDFLVKFRLFESIDKDV